MVETHNAELVRKLSARPITILNPPHLRPVADEKAHAAWAKTRRRLRSDAEDYGTRKTAGPTAAV